MSPIMRLDHVGTWRRNLRAIVKYMGKVCWMQVNDTCGLHIHVSPPEGVAWTLDHLKSISRSILYFEGAVNKLVPAHRRRSRWAMSNTVENWRLRGRTMEEQLAELDRCQSMVSLVYLMNDNGRRNYAWNLTNLYDTKGTIEFRQAPGVCDSRSASIWVEFVLHFVNSSQHLTTYEELLRYSRDTRGLLAFLIAFDLPGSSVSNLRKLFRRKYGYIDPTIADQFTRCEMEEQSE